MVSQMIQNSGREKWTSNPNHVHFGLQVDGQVKNAQLVELAGVLGGPLDENLRVRHHCPYVKSIHDRIVRDARELQQHGINSIAIMSNDPAEYAEDSFANMQLVAQQYDYPFPYVWDETQQVAKDYGAVCTPDFFGFNANLELQYRGRLDASRKEAVPDAPRDLFSAMLQIARTGQGPREQFASMGCSIKWKNAA